VNIHHLELFFHVARHGGIMEAVRNMPYGIQQPAVSGQILQLESDLGVKLFTRRPFELTDAGRELYAFVSPFFSQVEVVGERLRGGENQSLRLAASVFALREHLPDILRELRGKFPKLRINLRDAHQPAIAGLLEKREVDCAITVMEGPLSPGFQGERLIDIGAAFLVPKGHKAQNAEDLLERVAAGQERTPLISLPANEALPRRFKEFLSKRGMEWAPDIEVTALDLIDTYAAGGFGIGFTLRLPGKKISPGLRALPLEAMPPLVIGFVWSEPPTPPIEALRGILRIQADALAG
jgi:DNA-binding transcriptional LysR family regulator